MMEFIFSSLVEYFHLGDAYNVFVLNPKRDIRKGGYGYRLAPDYYRYHIILLRTRNIVDLQKDFAGEGFQTQRYLI